MNQTPFTNGSARPIAAPLPVQPGITSPEETTVPPLPMDRDAAPVQGSVTQIAAIVRCKNSRVARALSVVASAVSAIAQPSTMTGP